MNRIEDYAELTDDIVKWISDYCLLNKRKTLVVGISGGIDSSVVSTLSALTGMKTYVVGMLSIRLRVKKNFLMPMVNGCSQDSVMLLLSRLT